MGWSYHSGDQGQVAIEWSGGSVINLGLLPGSTFSIANAINDVGQVVGESGPGFRGMPLNGAADPSKIWVP